MVRFQQRTDFPPQLFLAGGPFDIKTSVWQGLPLMYVVPKGKSDLIDETFGETPDMLSYYSDLLGVGYPWPGASRLSTFSSGSGKIEWMR